MQQIAVLAKLKPGALERAEKLIEKGPPFNLDEAGFDRHSVFLTTSEAIFVFEGGVLDRLMEMLVRDLDVSKALGAWHSLVDGVPALAREAYHWRSAHPPA